jgi:hypothetical protein
VAEDQEAVQQVTGSSPFLLHFYYLLLLLRDLEKVDKSSKKQFESTQKITFFGLNTENYGNLRKFFRTFPLILGWGQHLEFVRRGTE